MSIIVALSLRSSLGVQRAVSVLIANSIFHQQCCDSYSPPFANISLLLKSIVNFMGVTSDTISRMTKRLEPLLVPEFHSEEDIVVFVATQMQRGVEVEAIKRDLKVVCERSLRASELFEHPQGQPHWPSNTP